ncbi:glycosyltransferase [Cavenderia fasciculata]|uniref:Alpha-1,3/1,6-mannosyltransferase ALG2 n=1 Tax=Cavenderia fasciculata TaxID=261658 RepID=F4PJS7_CACFS|nr:glycosyltransferase [Cavenderia fasciculata]EGG23851.1 glycosyltransferase [Cavenderia fasciculata]|eukprot:XP_004361702.1 glycosyltransferase [Cavenderia fasciculata]
MSLENLSKIECSRMGKNNSSTSSSSTTSNSGSKKEERLLKIAFLHPDLGIGGAERLVVDAALALKSKGHSVTMYTSRHDPKRSFKETHNGELEVKVAGGYFPRHLFWRFMVICAIIRNVLCALSIIFGKTKYDVVVIDQISASIPLFKLLSRSRVLFYCHFPDKLLTSRTSLLKKLYRVPVDWFEEYTTSWADRTVVNSNFTASIFKESFKSIHNLPSVLYPSLNLKQYDETKPSNEGLSFIPKDKKIILSINRYERKKNLLLALDAFKELRDKLQGDNNVDQYHVVIAGGYDPGLKENVEHLQELKQRCQELGISDHVSFVCSFNEEQRSWLLRNSICLVYTPSNEHFGITPLEGMYMRLPVVAVNSGGPLETVKNGVTGYLCNPTPKDFSTAFYKIVKANSKEMGNEGRKWVEKSFSFQQFANSLDDIVLSI